jgi:hypothetical protein
MPLHVLSVDDDDDDDDDSCGGGGGDGKRVLIAFIRFLNNNNNNLLYMGDIKLYEATNNQLQELLWLIQTFSRDIKMAFGIEKCETLCIAKRKLKMRIFTTGDDDIMEAMNEDDMYRYLGHMQAKQIKHARMKQKLGEEYLNCTKNILKTKLNGKNMIKAVNSYVTPILTCSFRIEK